MVERAQAVREQIMALEEGRAFVDLSGMRKILVAGDDAERWLNDLLTAGLADLRVGDARRSLLLTPTGRIRADLHVARTFAGFLLLQDARQPHPVQELLAPYVLSSAVSLSDRTDGLAVLAAPDLPVEAEAERFRPSPLEWGVGLVVNEARRGEIAAALRSTAIFEASPDAVEVRRIRLGRPRFPGDLDQDSLPAEGNLERLIDLLKGCFLGQESIAKVRNLGHPPRVVVRLRADAPVAHGDTVISGDQQTGKITSAVTENGGWAVLARVRWEDRDGDLRTSTGIYLHHLD